MLDVADVRCIAMLTLLSCKFLVSLSSRTSLMAEKGFVRITKEADDEIWKVIWRPRKTSKNSQAEGVHIPDYAMVASAKSMKEALELGDGWVVKHFPHQAQ